MITIVRINLKLKIFRKTHDVKTPKSLMQTLSNVHLISLRQEVKKKTWNFSAVPHGLFSMCVYMCGSVLI